MRELSHGLRHDCGLARCHDGQHISKGYIYSAMAFALLVEMINLRVRRASPVQVHSRFEGDVDTGARPPPGTVVRDS